ncbi:histidine phosphatase family protein [Mesobacillus maritimus]|uniref:histidine phosphatase family protein n=1 Tax=Mesobacillus maritimus TaxID=1643336 RepID=UPI00384F341F
MTTIGLVRHGVTEWNTLGRAQGVTDIPLSEVGKQQACDMGERLLQEEEKWDILITSDLKRSIETGQIIGEKLNISISHFDKRIQEINCGEIEGTTEEERIHRWGKNWRDLDLGMEKFEDVSKRGVEFLEEIANTYKGKRILIISHGALIGLTLQRILPEKFQKTYIDNTSITLLKYTENKWDCILYNCTKHLK